MSRFAFEICLGTFILLASMIVPTQAEQPGANLSTPSRWQYSAPLISPEPRDDSPSHAQKDPTVVFVAGRWHVFMTVKLPNRSAIEHCSFTDWKDANDSPRTLLKISDSDYFCAPQVFYFRPHQKWYLVYQMGVPQSKKMWVAYSTTTDINDPDSWTRAQPMLDGGPNDPRTIGGLDYWIICDDTKAHLFFTSLNGKMWHMWTDIDKFPAGLDHCEVALQAEIFEASHTYRVKGTGKFITLIEQKGRRYFKSYIADSLHGPWHPLADTEDHPFAGAKNVRPAKGVTPWTNNISHGELVRDGYDETLTVAPSQWRFVFQGTMSPNNAKQAAGAKQAYGAITWRIGMLTPAAP